MNNNQEFLNDMKADNCSCYKLGGVCYGSRGDYTHKVGEECNN